MTFCIASHQIDLYCHNLREISEDQINDALNGFIEQGSLVIKDIELTMVDVNQRISENYPEFVADYFIVSSDNELALAKEMLSDKQKEVAEIMIKEFLVL